MNLNDLPPGFDDPVETLLGFHRRIERQLASLASLPGQLDAHGADAASMSTAASALDFFSRAVRVHHDDEADLVRVLHLEEFGRRIQREHSEMDRAWRSLRRPLEAISAGMKRSIPVDLVRYFRGEYASHIAFEESSLDYAAARRLTAQDRIALARGMAARRARSYRFQ